MWWCSSGSPKKNMIPKEFPSQLCTFCYSFFFSFDTNFFLFFQTFALVAGGQSNIFFCILITEKFLFVFVFNLFETSKHTFMYTEHLSLSTITHSRSCFNYVVCTSPLCDKRSEFESLSFEKTLFFFLLAHCCSSSNAKHQLDGLSKNRAQQKKFHNFCSSRRGESTSSSNDVVFTVHALNLIFCRVLFFSARHQQQQKQEA